MGVVDVSDLVVRYGDTTAVDGLSFTADAGEVVAVLGPNGAGKTTTVETLEGYRRPTAGTVRVLGLDPIADRAAVVPRIGVMLQRGGVYPGMGPLEALRLFAAYYDAPADPDGLLDLVGLRDVARTAWRRLSEPSMRGTSSPGDRPIHRALSDSQTRPSSSVPSA